MTSFIEAEQLIMRNEGFRAHAYQCPAGKWTIGYGRNVDKSGGKGISEHEGRYLLHNDIADAAVFLQEYFYGTWENVNAVRQAVLIDMVHNLGFRRFMTFRNMIAAVKRGDHEAADREIMNSRYAKQVGGRAQRNAAMMRLGIVE